MQHLQTTQNMLCMNALPLCKPSHRAALLRIRRPHLCRTTARHLSIQAKRHDYTRESPNTQASQDYNGAQSASEYASEAYDVQQQQYPQSQGVPQYPGPPPQYKANASGGFPSVIWVVVGILIATVASKVWGVIRHPGGVQGWMMQQAMKTAMKSMPQQGQAGQANPFGAGFPGMPPNMPGMPQGMGQGMGQGWPPAVDTTARPAGGPQSQSSSSQDVSKGQRFQQYKAQEQAKQSSSGSASKPPQAAPMSSSGPTSSPFVSPPKQAASFTDVSEEEDSDASAASTSGASASTSSSSPGGFGSQMPGGYGGFNSQQQGQQQQQASSSNGGGGTGNGKQMLTMMESMMKDPKMQEMLYPYLPEGMRNPHTFEWMLSNPEYRAQLEGMLESQGIGFNPQMLENMKGQDMDQARQQLEQYGVSPDEVMQKILSDPELAQAFNKPEVQQAIMDIQSNPMNMLKYQQNPEVMSVINKMSVMFPQGGPPAGAPGQ